MTAAPPTSLFDVGALIDGKYRIERLLGQGGMGMVYAAHHELLAQSVALKVVLPEIAMNAEVVARFIHEARAAAKIDSDHVARVMDVGRLDDGTPFIVMELLVGSNLEDLLERDGPLSPQILADYVLQALDGVAQAHAMGIVHRDLKPANLFLAQKAGRAPRVKVLDFGISKALEGSALASAHVTSTRSILGSPGFMAPEQLRSSKRVDTRADIWSIGVILYQLATGRMPFDTHDVGSLFAAILEDGPIPPREARPDLPEALETIILRCLEKKPENRFQTVLELASALAPLGTATSSRALQEIERMSVPTLETAPAFKPVGTLAPLPASTGDKSAEAVVATTGGSFDQVPPALPALKTNGNWTSQPGVSPIVAPPRAARAVTIAALGGVLLVFGGLAAFVGSRSDSMTHTATESSSIAQEATRPAASAARSPEPSAAPASPPSTGVAPVDSASAPPPASAASAASSAAPHVPVPTKKQPARSDPDDLFSRH